MTTLGRRGLSWVMRAAPVVLAILVAGVLLTVLDPAAKVPDTATDRATPASAAGKPNIVEFLVDDMRVDDLAYMPNVRRLIGDHGITMQNAFSSYPLCCPARASFFSGQLPHNHHVWTVQAPYAYSAFDDSHSIATSLQAAGYHTGLSGKYLNGYGMMSSKGGWRLRKTTVDGKTVWKRVRVPASTTLRSAYKIPNGWDQWHGFLDQTSKVHSVRTGRQVTGGTYRFFHVAESDNGDPKTVQKGTYSSEIVGDETVSMVNRFHEERQPFFLSVNFPAPHVGPGNRAEKARDRRVGLDGLRSTASPAWTYGRFNKVIKRAPGVLPDGHTEADANHDGRDTTADTADKPRSWGRIPALGPKKRNAVRATARQRAESLYATDQQIGRVIRRLKATGEWSNTVVVFWSDNGYFQGEHHRAAGKILEYNPVIRVPMLITGPGMRVASNRDDPVDVVDLTRTLLDFAGADPPRTPDGTSFRSTLLRGDRGWTYGMPYEEGWTMPGQGSAQHHDPDFPVVRRARTFMHQRHVNGQLGQGVKTSRYIYVRFADGSEELYDEAVDPFEMNNVAGKPAYAAVKRQLRAVAHKLMHCKGSACRVPLPDSLKAWPVANRKATLRYWSRVYGTYGNSLQKAYWRTQKRR